MPQPQPNALDLTTLQNVKQWLHVTSADEDATLQRLITAISLVVQQYLNRTIAVQSYTEVVNGNGLRAMMVGNYPIVSVASLMIDGRVIPPRPAPGQPGFYFDRDTIYVDRDCFTRGGQNVERVYSAGFPATPFDLEQAVIELVVVRHKERDRIGLASQAIAGETTSYSIKAMPDDVKAILDQYRRVTPMGL